MRNMSLVVQSPAVENLLRLATSLHLAQGRPSTFEVLNGLSGGSRQGHLAQRLTGGGRVKFRLRLLQHSRQTQLDIGAHDHLATSIGQVIGQRVARCRVEHRIVGPISADVFQNAGGHALA